jgi:hypothetical protein
VKVGDREVSGLGFCEAYAARAYLTEALGNDLEVVTAKLANSEIGEVSGEGVEEILGAMLTREERNWELPEPYRAEAKWLRTGAPSWRSEMPPVVSGGGGLVTLRQITRGTSIPFNRAKRMLRIAGIRGMSWQGSELENVRKLLKLGVVS